ncbi:MAG: three-Cys-motif partner protein TcmP [Acidimicrobiia bacterium]
MANPPGAFFIERQPAAVLKHGILRRYLQPFASKTGVNAPDRRVVYLDAYAGPGTYSDGAPGSPALAEQTAQAVSGSRNLDCIYVEKDQRLFDQLCLMLDGYDNWSAYPDSIDNCLPDVMTEVGKAPLFAFLDPFGLPLSFNDLVGHLLRRPLSRKTEVLLNFSTPGLNRTAGHLTSANKYPAKDSLLAGIDERLGGPWWHDMWRNNEPPSRNELILQEYVRRLASAGTGGWGWYMIPVSNRPQVPPIYHLIFLTRHRDGLWLFNESLSLALEDYHDFCNQGRLDIDPLEERERRWVNEIHDNIEQALVHGSFVVQDKLDEVCGQAFGYAREKHIRQAIKRLRALKCGVL